MRIGQQGQIRALVRRRAAKGRATPGWGSVSHNNCPKHGRMVTWRAKFPKRGLFVAEAACSSGAAELGVTA